MIAAIEPATVEAAETAFEIRGARPEHDWNIDPTEEGEIGPRIRTRQAENKGFARPRPLRPPGRQ